LIWKRGWLLGCSLVGWFILLKIEASSVLLKYVFTSLFKA
jgi:hypothetical protein